MVKRYRKPFKYTGLHRSTGRLALLRALSSEYEFGNSLSKLYVPLLVKALVAQDAKLDNEIYYLEKCGVFKSKTPV